MFPNGQVPVKKQKRQVENLPFEVMLKKNAYFFFSSFFSAFFSSFLSAATALKLTAAKIEARTIARILFMVFLSVVAT